jgi:membrane-associated phospholipid phosphatase
MRVPGALRWIAGFGLTVILVLGAIHWVDRPGASFAHEHLVPFFRHPWSGASFLEENPTLANFLTAPGSFGPTLSGLSLVVLGLAAAGGWRPGRGGRVIIAVAVAILVAVPIKEDLKFAFGHVWPETWVADNPSWIHDHISGFFPFHGGKGWAAFPSGHTTVAAAFAAVLWPVSRGLRLLGIAVLAAVVIGLFGANYHWISDMIAGLFLGLAVGTGIGGLILQPPDRRA